MASNIRFTWWKRPSWMVNSISEVSPVFKTFNFAGSDFDMDILATIAKELNIKETQVENAVKLIDEGNTIPFIARYRKEMHGTMDDQLLREIADRLQYLRNLDERREEIISSIEAQEKMTDEIRESIEKAETMADLENIYRPFRPKRQTRASIARDKGLEPLAALLMEQKKNY